MNLSSARTRIHRALERMHTLYGRDVFNEWALVSLSGGSAALLAYEGPRLEQFRSSFVADSTQLREVLRGRTLTAGDFAFAPAASGTSFDATICIGATAYLLLNDTDRTMEQIRQEPRWLDAQREFAALSEAFRQDPLA